MAQSFLVTDTGSVTLQPMGDGQSGRWFFQVTAYSGLTSMTPSISADGVTYVTTGITPYSRGAVVTTLAATGGWIVDVGNCWFKLTGVGTGTATVVVQPALD
jgi:hypothetical protein